MKLVYSWDQYRHLQLAESQIPIWSPYVWLVITQSFKNWPTSCHRAFVSLWPELRAFGSSFTMIHLEPGRA